MLTYRILTGDVRERLRLLPDGCVQTCVTSPPYWGLRDYGHEGQIGLEGTPEAFVGNLVAVFGEVRRVLADDGTLWLNLGDTFNSSPSNQHSQAVGANGSKAIGLSVGRQRRDICGLKPKDLVGIPWRVAFALQADGWYLRSDIIWSKPNPMPESVTDRPTKAHEYIFLLSKSPRYFYDADAVREPYLMSSGSAYSDAAGKTQRGANGFRVEGQKMREHPGQHSGMGASAYSHNGRNKRSVWHVATQPYPDAHFATYPEKLIEPCILAGSRPGDTVLDPFTGSGTTGAVALRHQRNFIGCELNPDYVKLAEKRIGSVAPLFACQSYGESQADDAVREESA